VAVPLLAIAAVAWIAVLSALAAILLSPTLRALVVARFDALGLTLPIVGKLSGEAMVSRVLDKLAMLSFAIVPVLLLEAALLRTGESSLARICRGRSTSSLTDLAMYALNLIGLWKYLAILLTFGVVFAVGALVNVILGTMVQLDLRIRTGSLLLDSALAFLLFTFCDYWNHRLQHRAPLWPLHRIHHGATEFTVLTLWREHPAIAAVEPLIKLWPLVLFDIPAATVAVVGMVTIAYEHLIHSNLRWDWGWFGRWVLIPPMGHRLHHHIDPARQQKNFGIPVLWDRAFGTWDGSAPPDELLGVGDVAYNTGALHRELWRDLTDFLAAIWRPVAGLVRR
jgi:sterol desaturase/sphingolipid hydroxylase (fatty acid hydroxylase superfamily)